LVNKTLVIDPKLCTGCRLCELVCSFKKTETYNPARARIRTIVFEDEIAFVPMTCWQCEEPVCQEVCPTGAVMRDEGTGAVTISVERCIGCKMCMMVCPFGNIQSDGSGELVVKCDLCGGDPECVVFCPTKALQYLPADKFTLARKKRIAGKFRSILEEVEW
jgi:carbon-monoxide dehydrogenase iron sulfur subunit